MSEYKYRKITHPWIELRLPDGKSLLKIAYGGPKYVGREKRMIVKDLLIRIKRFYWNEPLAQQVYAEIEGAADPFNKVYYLGAVELPKEEKPLAREVEEAKLKVEGRLDEIYQELAERSRAYRESIKELVKMRDEYNEVHQRLTEKLEDFVARGYRKEM